ncbi:MAG TPA: metal ABC transporter ATP-binding protein [Acidimicrobiales bacterium]|nr:metal ABC transporter ATP-binding protein [Acidimicrobiales bacterium]
MPPPHALTASSLTLAHGTRPALEGATFAIPAGALVALIGPNGSGKSSLLRAAAGLLAPRGGSIEVPAARRRGGVSLVLQTTDVDAALPLTVAEAVAMARYPHRGGLRRFRADDRRAVAVAMERMDVADLARRQLHQLSGGQRQRVLVAQGLAQEADLLLLDEPVTGLDVVSRGRIEGAMAEEVAAGRTVLVSTHDLADARRADLVLLLANRVVAFGPPDEALTDVALAEAYGGRLVRLGGDLVVLDDPHHHGREPCADQTHRHDHPHTALHPSP